MTQVLGYMFVHGSFNHCLDSWELEWSRKKGEKKIKKNHQAAPPVPSGHEQRRKNFELSPAEKSASSNPEIIP